MVLISLGGAPPSYRVFRASVAFGAPFGVHLDTFHFGVRLGTRVSDLPFGVHSSWVSDHPSGPTWGVRSSGVASSGVRLGNLGLVATLERVGARVADWTPVRAETSASFCRSVPAPVPPSSLILD